MKVMYRTQVHFDIIFFCNGGMQVGKKNDLS